MTDPAPKPRRRRRRTLLALGALAGLLVGVGAWTAGRHGSKPAHPSPNGHDDLTRAGALIQGPWPGGGDLAKADLEAVRPFLAANEPALELARLGLMRECVASFPNSQEGLTKNGEDQGRIRSVSRLIRAQARVFEADGRLVDASRNCRELLELGQAATQGGMGNDMALGSVLQGQALDRLRSLRDRLPADECRAILRDLESLDRRRVTLGAVLARHDRWYRGTFGLVQRTWFRLNGLEQEGRAGQLSIAKLVRDRIERAMRFFQVGLAIHTHHLDRREWPRSVAELVPRYLAAVPIDPATGQPIDYPKNPSGELTDDLGAIGRADGRVDTPGP